MLEDTKSYIAVTFELFCYIFMTWIYTFFSKYLNGAEPSCFCSQMSVHDILGYTISYTAPLCTRLQHAVQMQAATQRSASGVVRRSVSSHCQFTLTHTLKEKTHQTISIACQQTLKLIASLPSHWTYTKSSSSRSFK